LILEDFDLNAKVEQEKMHLFLKRKYSTKEYNNRQLISKESLNEITIKDFPPEVNHLSTN
jgi:hypothetical protein